MTPGSMMSQKGIRATSSNSIVACGGGRGIGSTRKSRLEIAGDSDVMEMTGDWSFSAGSLKEREDRVLQNGIQHVR